MSSYSNNCLHLTYQCSFEALLSSNQAGMVDESSAVSEYLVTFLPITVCEKLTRLGDLNRFALFSSSCLQILLPLRIKRVTWSGGGGNSPAGFRASS